MNSSKNKLISIIIPVYNAEKYIVETLESIRKQSIENWELVIVDDASEDNTELVIQEYIKEHPSRSIVYEKLSQNSNAAVARNEAMKIAKGSLFAFCDADDLWESNHLEVALKYIEKEQADIVYSTMNVVDDQTGEKIGMQGPSEEHINDFPNSLFWSPYNFIQPSAVVMKRGVYEDVGGFDASFRRSQDFEYFLNIVGAGYSFYYISDITSNLRRGHISSVSSISLLAEYHALALRKHRSINRVPRSIRMDALSYSHLIVAKNVYKKKPIKAAFFLFWSWFGNPIKIKYLLFIPLLYIYSFFSQFKNLFYIEEKKKF
ncbi:glycosyl transferase family 2 [[Leptolyngbya] sp. PCC 7376]|uniref:glycosyltransferase family 2 protein n=1 Tax=[Leptolyngbya] sp. PCC 7376 TaxID=111781 RepID=UPI00029F2926|nr:glycosyltransferase family A protein [[Leptolyngbya] sp. PCC 7376]AFY37721.1 glycosyl transferase family 2 [[Leptolyngbya] sp. PCC 7376]